MSLYLLAGGLLNNQTNNTGDKNNTILSITFYDGRFINRDIPFASPAGFTEHSFLSLCNLFLLLTKVQPKFKAKLTLTSWIT